MTVKELKEVIDGLVVAGYGKQPLVYADDSFMESGKSMPIISVAFLPFDENSTKPKIRIIIKNIP
jgi:hypothetical protein